MLLPSEGLIVGLILEERYGISKPALLSLGATLDILLDGSQGEISS